MDGYQFIAAVFQSIASLAWPLAFFCAVFVFREQLRGLLPRFQLKYKDAEASFRLDEAAKEVASLPPRPIDADAQPTPEEIDKFMRLADISPRAAILEMRSELEEAVRRLAESADV